MNKPADDSTTKNRVNRNLSPSFARIQARISDPQSQVAERPTDDAPPAMASKQHPTEQRVEASAPTRIHSTAAAKTPNERKASLTTPLTTPTQTTHHHGSTISPVRITPWLIASITLTLALFSGNYAWHTQQDVEKLNQRIEQFETQLIRPTPAAPLPASNDSFAKVEQDLLSLNESQGQLATTVSTLQNTYKSDAEQTVSQLTALEKALAGLSHQLQEATLKKESNKPPIAQMADSTTPLTETTSSETNSDAKTNVPVERESTENWFINIGSFSDPAAANNTYKKAHKITDKTSIQPITVKGQTLYRIRADGYRSREGAEREAQALQTQLKLPGLWISLD